MALEQKQQFNIPLEITFHMWEKDITITRKDGFCDISEIRNDAGVKNLSNFQKYQKVFLDKVKKEIDDEPIKTNGNTTLVHEKILERVLRWYEIPEADVIDKFVHPEERTIGQYKYNKVEILVHLESKYVNGSKFCPLFGKQMHRWMDLKGTKELLNHYAGHNKIDSVEIIKKGLEYDSADIWIPQNLLPMLAMWCSPEYSIFVSDVMNLFHTDPMKLASMAIKEHDRQTGTKTTAFFKSTDNDDEHIKNLQEQLEFTKKQVEEHAATIIDQEGKILTLEELIQSQVTHIQKLKDNVYRITYEKDIAEKDFTSIVEDTKKLVSLRNEYGENVVTDQVENKKKWLDKCMIPYDDKIAELEKQVDAERREKIKIREEVKALADENSSLFDEKLILEEELQEMLSSKSKKKTKSRSTKRVYNDEEHGNISSAAPAGSCHHLSIYTKRDHNGDSIALVPGRSTNFRTYNFKYRGIINFNVKNTAEHYLTNFIDNNSNSYISYIGLTFVLDKTFTPESFERLFTIFTGDDVLSKFTYHDIKISPKDAVCCY